MFLKINVGVNSKKSSLKVTVPGGVENDNAPHMLGQRRCRLPMAISRVLPVLFDAIIAPLFWGKASAAVQANPWFSSPERVFVALS